MRIFPPLYIETSSPVTKQKKSFTSISEIYTKQ